jgi:hypothetical protein
MGDEEPVIEESPYLGVSRELRLYGDGDAMVGRKLWLLGRKPDAAMAESIAAGATELVVDEFAVAAETVAEPVEGRKGLVRSECLTVKVAIFAGSGVDAL